MSENDNTQSGTMPSVWGAGQLLAFSAVDGRTNWDEPLVLHTGAAPGDLQVLLPVRLPITFHTMPPLTFTAILGDAIVAAGPCGPFRVAFDHHHTIVGEVPAGVTMRIGDQQVTDQIHLAGRDERVGVYAARRGNRWALVAVPSQDHSSAADRLARALTLDLSATVDARMAYISKMSIPEGLDAGRVRLLRKAVSVMKVNVESPCGQISRRWSTPDRWPHRKMWLWDTAFHGIGLSLSDPAIGQEIVSAMLDQVQDDGMLAHMVSPHERSLITQPPVLAWAVKTLFLKTHDEQWARQCIGPLERFLEWVRLHRDKNNNGIPEWFIEDDPSCRSGESGMDNSPRFDFGANLDAVDFACFLAHDYRCLADIAAALGLTDRANTYALHADHIASAVNNLLWSERDGLYMDRRLDGKLSTVKAVSGFLPLFAGIADRQRAQCLCGHLTNPKTFGAAFPIPSVALDSGTYCKDMWRGPTWINLNYMIILGLRRYGFAEEARRLKEQTLSVVQRWYEAEGCLFEYYDSLGVTSPRNLDRKQRLSRDSSGIAPISDYHWTAALTAALLMERDELT